MSTVKEVESRLRKEKKINKELIKEIEEKNLHIKFLTDRLDTRTDEKFRLNTGVLNMTVDQFIEMKQKSNGNLSR
jgi:hypothetical protein|tara:strand:+ start:167 stop:391 length:225 start_codon:yes stop_codon:yes gene_type:complete